MSANEIDRNAENEASRFLRERKASRKPEAAPSDPHIGVEHEGYCHLQHGLGGKCSCTSQPVQVEVTVDEWGTAVAIERSRHPEKGYTVEHDREHGLKHLANWAIDYARRGKTVESSAMVLALVDVAESVRESIEQLVNDLDAARADGTIYTYGQIQERLRAALGGGDHAE